MGIAFAVAFRHTEARSNKFVVRLRDTSMRRLKKEVLKKSKTGFFTKFKPDCSECSQRTAHEKGPSGSGNLGSVGSVLRHEIRRSTRDLGGSAGGGGSASTA